MCVCVCAKEYVWVNKLNGGREKNIKICTAHTPASRCCYFWSMQNVNLMKNQQQIHNGTSNKRRNANKYCEKRKRKKKEKTTHTHRPQSAHKQRPRHHGVTADWVRKESQIVYWHLSTFISIYFSTSWCPLARLVANAIFFQRKSYIIRAIAASIP